MFLPGHENPEVIREIVERQSKLKGFEFLQRKKKSKQQLQKIKNHLTARVITKSPFGTTSLCIRSVYKILKMPPSIEK